MDKQVIIDLINKTIQAYQKEIDACKFFALNVEDLKKEQDKNKALQAIQSMLKLESKIVFYNGAIEALKKLFEEIKYRT